MSQFLDPLLTAADGALRTLFAAPRARRPNPAAQVPAPDLSTQERALAGALMRVNHVGEVCAQALYAAQALSTRDATCARTFSRRAKKKKTTWPGRMSAFKSWVHAPRC